MSRVNPRSLSLSTLLFVAVLITPTAYTPFIKASTLPLRIIFTGGISGYYWGYRDSVSSRVHGGLPEYAAVIEKYKKETSSPTLVLDLGNIAGWGLLDSIDHGQVHVDYYSQIGVDAIALGTRDLLYGLDSFTGSRNRSIDKTRRTYKTIASTLEFIGNDATLLADGVIVKNVVVEVSPGVEVGIVSIQDPQLCQFSSCRLNGKEAVRAREDIVSAVNEEIHRLRANHPGVVMVVTLETASEADETFGNSNLNEERVVVIGSDVHLFMYWVKDGVDIQTKSHPTMYTRTPFVNSTVVDRNKQVIVGSVPRSTSVGLIDLQIDTVKKSIQMNTNGRNQIIPVLKCEDSLVLENGEECFVGNAAVKSALDTHWSSVQSSTSQIIGYNPGPVIDGSAVECRYQQCSLGSFFTQALMYTARVVNQPCEFAVVNAGAFRGNISIGNITISDVLNSFPFNGAIKVLNLTGQAILEMFENSVRLVPPNPTPSIMADVVLYGGTARFLHLGGAHMYYDSEQAVWGRVHTVYLENPNIEGPTGYRKLQRNSTYTMCASDYLSNGGDSYSFGSSAEGIVHIERTVHEALLLFLNISTSSRSAQSAQWNTAPPRIALIPIEELCPGGCDRGICLSNNSCICTSVSYGGDACSTFLLNAFPTCSDHKRSAQGYLDRFQDAVDIDKAGTYLMLVMHLVTLTVTLFVCRLVWKKSLSIWSIKSRFPMVGKQSPEFWDSFTFYRLKRTPENYLRFVTLGLEIVQLTSFPFWAHVDWVWLPEFREFVSIASGVIEEIWFFWVIVVLVLLWLLYGLILYFEIDTLLERTKAGRAFIAPCSLYLLLFSSAGYIPSCTQFFIAMNCQVVSSNYYNRTFIQLAEQSLSEEGTQLGGNSHLQYELTHMFIVPYDCVECFTSDHWPMMAFTFVLVVLYIPLSIYTCYMWQEFYTCEELQIRFNPKYLVILTVVKTAMVGIRVFFSPYPRIYLTFLVTVFSAVAYISLKYQPCSFIPMNYWGTIGFVTGAMGSIVTLLLVGAEYADGNENGDKATFIVMGVCGCVLLLMFVIFHIYTPVELESNVGSRDGKDILKSMITAAKDSTATRAPKAPKTSDDIGVMVGASAAGDVSEVIEQSHWFQNLFTTPTGTGPNNEPVNIPNSSPGSPHSARGYVRKDLSSLHNIDIRADTHHHHHTFARHRQKTRRNIFQEQHLEGRASLSQIHPYTDNSNGTTPAITTTTASTTTTTTTTTLDGVSLSAKMDDSSGTDEHRVGEIIRGVSVSRDGAIVADVLSQASVEDNLNNRQMQIAWEQIAMAMDELVVVIRVKIRELSPSYDRKWEGKAESTEVKTLLEFYERLDVFITSLIKSKSSLLLSHFYAIELKIREEMHSTMGYLFSHSNTDVTETSSRLTFQEQLNESEGTSEREGALCTIRHQFKAAVLSLCAHCVAPQMTVGQYEGKNERRSLLIAEEDEAAKGKGELEKLVMMKGCEGYEKGAEIFASLASISTKQVRSEGS
eukprot:Nk52_evm84s352 gene=Nk52_evmTU84s352